MNHEHEWVKFKQGRNKEIIMCKKCCISKDASEYMDKVGKRK